MFNDMQKSFDDDNREINREQLLSQRVIRSPNFPFESFRSVFISPPYKSAGGCSYFYMRQY